MKNRILVLTSTYPFPRDDSQPSFIRSLCKEVGKKHELYVLAPAIGGRCEGEQDQNLKVVRYRYFCSKFESLCGGDGMLENLKRNKWLYLTVPFLLLAQMVSAIKLIRQHNIRTVHAHWIMPQGFVLWTLSRLFKEKLTYVVTSHGGDLFALQGGLMKALKKRILYSADYITVVSTAMKNYCIDELAVEPDRVRVLPMGVDLTNKFSSKPRTEGSPVPRLVYVGRLAEKKGVDVLLNAISSLNEKGKKFHLDVVGGGSQLNKYRALAKTLGIDSKVVFHGFIPNEQVPDFLRKSDIAVFPFKVARDGDQEGLGLTMVEAMGCGCAVVASDLPAVKDVIKHNVTGLLAMPGNFDSLADSISLLLCNPDLRFEIATQGNQFAREHFDWSVCSSGYSRLFDQAL